MNIRVQLWGVVARQAGCERMVLTLTEPATVADAAARLGSELGLVDLARCAFAVEDRIVTRGYALNEDDELAVLPPVSGG